MRRPASANRCLRSAWVATMVPLPGSARPSASIRQFIELAVNIPEQDPQVGHAERSISAENSSVMRGSAAAIMASTRSTERTRSPCCTLPASMGPPETKIGGNVQAQRRHQHAGRNFVAIGNADQGVGAVRVRHVLDAVGDQFPRGQAVQHAAVAHGDAVIHGDGVELLGDSAGALDLSGYELSEVLQVDVAGHELGEGVGHGDDGLAEISVLHSGGAPEAARAGHVAAVSGGARAINGHVCFTIPARCRRRNLTV